MPKTLGERAALKAETLVAERMSVWQVDRERALFEEMAIHAVVLADLIVMSQKAPSESSLILYRVLSEKYREEVTRRWNSQPSSTSSSPGSTPLSGSSSHTPRHRASGTSSPSMHSESPV